MGQTDKQTWNCLRFWKLVSLTVLFFKVHLSCFCNVWYYAWETYLFDPSLRFCHSPVISQVLWQIRPRPNVPRYFSNPQLFLSGLKNFMSTRIHIQIEFARPHASTRIQYHSRNQHWEYWKQSMHRGCHLKYSIHSEELSSILLRHRVKKYLDLASTRFQNQSVFKNRIRVSGNKKVRFQKCPKYV